MKIYPQARKIPVYEDGQAVTVEIMLSWLSDHADKNMRSVLAVQRVVVTGIRPMTEFHARESANILDLALELVRNSATILPTSFGWRVIEVEDEDALASLEELENVDMQAEDWMIQEVPPAQAPHPTSAMSRFIVRGECERFIDAIDYVTFFRRTRDGDLFTPFGLSESQMFTCVDCNSDELCEEHRPREDWE